MTTGIREKITWLIFTSTLIALVMSSLVAFIIIKNNYINALEAKASAIGMAIRMPVESSLDLGFPITEIAGLSNRLEATISAHKDISNAYVTDTAGKVLYHSNHALEGSATNLSEADERARPVEGSAYATRIRVDGEDINQVIIPLFSDKEHVGDLRLDIKISTLNSYLIPFAIAFIAVGAATLTVFFFVASVIARKMTIPVYELEKASIEMAKGNFKARADVKNTNDEISRLGETFNFMAAEIEDKAMQLEKNIADLNKLLTIKTDFLKIINHQIRTPMSVMLGYIDMWKTGQYKKLSTEKQEEIQQKIISASDQLSDIVNNMIEAIEVEGGRLKIRAKKIDGFKEIKNIFTTDFEDKIKAKGLGYSIEKTGETELETDPVYFGIVATNLIDNALKYTLKGKLDVYITGLADKIIIEISDTGIGLSKEDITGLYEKFFRGKEAAKITTDGSGIGLYIVKQIIEALKGSIYAESKGRSKGSKFTVTIPKLKWKQEK